MQKTRGNTLIRRFLQGIWVHTQREDRENTIRVWSPQGNCHSHNENTKVKVRSPDWDRYFFDIVAGVLEEDTLAPYLFIIYLDNLIRTSIDLMNEKGFTLKKTSSRRYPAQTITDADYTDDIVLLANTPTQAESLLHNLEQAAEGIRLYMNADKTEYMCFS